MEVQTIIILASVMLATSFLSGVFGMLGGIVLMGALLNWLSVPAAMILHAVTQMTANGWRAYLWRRHIMPGILPLYLFGSLGVFVLLLIFSFSPPKPWVLLTLGIIPFAARAVPSSLSLDIRRPGTPVAIGAIIMALNVLAGVAGPLLDVFFLARDLDRRDVVATKAATQTLGHLLKMLYFAILGGVLAGGASSIFRDGELPFLMFPLAILAALLGTTLAKPVLARFPNDRFQAWSRFLVLLIGAYYLWRGVSELAA